MKTVGVITFHSAENSGAALQCVALQKAIRNLGGNPYVIDYQPAYIKKQYRVLLNPFAEARKKGRGAATYVKSVLAYAVQDLHFSRRLSRKRRFAAFRKKHMTLSRTYGSCAELCENPPAADVYIAGSDQIWNDTLTGGRLDPAYFLRFGGRETARYTYAISIGKTLSESDARSVRALAEDIETVSFRERSVYERFAGSAEDRRFTVSVDPTLLIDREDWYGLVASRQYQKPYILVYALEKNDAFQRILSEMGEQKDMLVVDISQCNLYLSGDPVRRMGFAPDEFLSLIANADMVITNSFHCTVFSTIFHKRFITVPHTRSNARLEDLLRQLGLTDHIYTGDLSAISQTTDWTAVDSRIEAYSAQSRAYLQEIVT